MNSQDRQVRIIAAGLFVSLFFVWAGGYNTSPVFLGALLKAFGWSHSKVSWMPSAIILAVGITGPFAGWLLDRLEALIVMGVGAALAGASFIAASRWCWPRRWDLRASALFTAGAGVCHFGAFRWSAHCRTALRPHS